MFPLSRTMRLEDYKELKWEVGVVNTVQKLAGPTHPHQHEHRKWEYAMVVRAVQVWLAQDGKSKRKAPLQVGDFGCGVGLTPSIMLHHGCDVSMYEVWAHDQGEKFQLEACASTKEHSENAIGLYRMLHRPIGGLVLEDYGRYDISLCISTLEHIPDPVRAFKDLCRTVTPGGLLFVTTDFADKEEDRFSHWTLRAGKMFTWQTYQELMAAGQEEGFRLLDCASDWIWNENCRLVYDYGFASLAMVRE